MNLLYLLIAILKIIGITLLIITLVLLFIIMLILFVPIKYKLYINKQDTIYASTYINWLYSIIGLEIIYESDQPMDRFIKLFGKRIFSIKDENQKKEEKLEKDKLRKKKVKNNQRKEIKEEKISKKIKTKKKKIKNKKQKIKSKKQKSKLKDIFKQITSFNYKKELLEDTLLWIKKILKEIMPSKLYVDLEIGKDDPADTGELIGKLAILYPFYYSIATIKGNYDKKCFYAILDASGDIYLGKVLYDFIQYIRTQSVKQMMKFIKENRREKKDGRKVTN